jgi:hypothetical protein
MTITNSDISPAYVENEATLSRDLGIAITNIHKHNSFDKERLIKLLKRAREFVEDHQPIMAKRQAM